MAGVLYAQMPRTKTRPRRQQTTAWILAIAFLYHVASLRAAELSAEAVVLTDTDAPVAVAAAWQAAVPSLIGADGPLLTQVDAAQKLGLSGKDMTVCVIDTGVDVTHPNFGSCTDGIRSRGCRVSFGYDAETDSRDPSPRSVDGDSAEAGHGTHVAGIAVGSFPEKLLDANGKPLPYQRGVAFGANLGAIRAVNRDGAFPGEYLNTALHKTAREDCDVDNLSLGSFNVVPNPAYRQGMEEVADADILTAAAAGNDEGALTLGPRLFNTASPASYPRVFAVAHLNNTANPGSLIQVSESINTATGTRSMLVAIQRADTQSSITTICMPACDGLKLPMNLYLVKMGAERSARGSTECGLKLIFDPSEYKKDQVVVVMFESECKFYHTAPDLWNYLRAMSPALVLMVMPTDADSHTGALYYKNAQTPVLWMRSDDGRALAEDLALRDSKSMRPLQLKSIPGATVIPLPDAYAGQPALTSSMGPAFDLSIKPDIACPGSLYSSLPNDTYQTWPGTSQSSPYMAGVLALWKERMVSQLKLSRPAGGWINAAFTAFKNTAKPIKYGDTNLVWPPAKVGAGMVQAFFAVVNNVSVTPAELHLRTDTPQQAFSLTIINQGSTEVTYTLGHQPAVTLSLYKSWYNKAFDPEAPTAIVSGLERTVRVPAKGSRVIRLGLTIPPDLQALDAIVSGYITLTPAGASAYALTRKPLSTSSPITLSVPYQGSSKDYSTIGTAESLALFVPALPDLHATAAQLISEKPPLYVCDYSTNSGCAYSPEGVTITSESTITGFMFASTLLRPLADVKIQVWLAGSSGDHEELLGTSDSLGPAPASSPFRRTYLFEGSWDGSYLPVDSATQVYIPMQRGIQYKLKLELWPVLAAGDKAAGRSNGQPLIYTVHEPVVMMADPSASTATIQVASTRRSRDRDRDSHRDRDRERDRDRRNT